MIAGIVGGETAERVLLFLAAFDEGYTREIAANFDLSPGQVHEQLVRFEDAGALVSQMKGRTRIFSWNPRWALRRELLAFLNRALHILPESEHEAYFRERRRPRPTRKPSP